jgi:hypothetical protein
VRQIDLGLDGIRFRAGRRGFRGSMLSVTTKMTAHALRFIKLKRTRVGLLLRDAHFGKDVKNLLALDFQFPGQIVDSNLTHPPSVSSSR